MFHLTSLIFLVASLHLVFFLSLRFVMHLQTNFISLLVNANQCEVGIKIFLSFSLSFFSLFWLLAIRYTHIRNMWKQQPKFERQTERERNRRNAVENYSICYLKLLIIIRVLNCIDRFSFRHCNLVRLKKDENYFCSFANRILFSASHRPNI